ncbi:hypothetical protein C8A05DRAFT_36745 [Staphylotrichum tortipilum]|uniref:NB-ARC domain-containing protein n=1 Tax=Staphylotrichum tortipilum TaxID=2831512 RepID=A0AAN6MGE4_9PEZI|nr:hypothetical protein C8A05DRAFT_36745 [Staphylotrichum longicolle]
MSWRDKALVGLFKQGKIKTLSEQLQSCKATLSFAAEFSGTSEDIIKMISAGDAGVTGALATTTDQLSAMLAQLSALQVATQASTAQSGEKDDASGAMERGIIRINSVPPEPPSVSPKPCAKIPISRRPGFVNRGDIIKQMYKKCAEPPQRVALVGLGGVGKSQLAIEFAHQIAEKSPDTWIFWIHAANRGLVQQGFRIMADAVHLPGRNDPGANIPLLVADDQTVFYNAAPTPSSAVPGSSSSGTTPSSDEARRPLAFYFPQTANGSILVTTRPVAE